MKNKTEKNYKNYGISAVGNVHSLAGSVIESLGLPRDAELLDLGAGEGAFSARLSDAGFSNIEACEIVPGKFRVPGVPCHETDLNGASFSDAFAKKYDLIIAIELIEHLENPSNFLRNVSKLLKPSGHILISTPNVASWYSRLLFLRYGRLHWFDQNSHASSGHYHPVFDWQIDSFSQESGLKLVSSANTDNRLLIDRYIFPKGIIRALLSRTVYLLLLLPLMKNDKAGEIKLWLLQKK
jgi:2-polyprenyl-3-methyl-5-hydroxy-6-metoxy-1,4-benzoquinol methylase